MRGKSFAMCCERCRSFVLTCRFVPDALAQKQISCIATAPADPRARYEFVRGNFSVSAITFDLTRVINELGCTALQYDPIYGRI